jgi:predicted TIM-barrel fold metal-dependent hydrolase
VHVHAHRTPPPRAYCAGSGRIGTTDEDGLPLCDRPLEPAADGADLMARTIEYLDRYDMYAVAMTQDFAQLEAWTRASARVFPSIQTGVTDFDANRVRELVENGSVIAIGEVMSQYEGISPDDAELEKIWALAVEHDVPVGIHMSAPGAQLPDYVAGYGNPILIEPVLRRHPDLRLYLMHAGWPFLEETVSILRQYPKVYVDISFIDWQMPRDLFHRYLEDLVRHGFGKRIMFGTDQNWPDAIPIAIESVERAPFLSAEQKRDILFDNAVRFFRLREEDLAVR